MRILFLVHRLPYPPNKGDKIRSFRELEALSQRHEVDVFCFYDDPEDSKYVEALSAHCRECYAERISWFGSRMQALLAVLLGRAFTLGFFYSQRMAGRVREAVASRNYDLIFIYCSSMAQYAEMADSIPWVLDMVDVDSEKWVQYARHTRPPSCWFYRLEGERLAVYERRVAGKSAICLVCTEAEAELLGKFGMPQKVVVLENAMDVEYFDPHRVEVPPEIIPWQPYVIFTGSMDYYPNVDAVSYFYHEVFPRVRSFIPELRFVIAGRNPARPIRNLAADPAVWVTGAVPDIRPLLRGAAAAVAPMRIARGVQNKVLEAMAMGLPTATSKSAARALPKSLAARLLVEDDPTRLAEGLVQLIEHRQKPPREEIRQAVVEHFGSRDLPTQLESVLDRAIRSHQRGAQQGVQMSEQTRLSSRMAASGVADSQRSEKDFLEVG